MLRATTSCLSTPNSFMNSSNRCVNKQVTFSHQHSPAVAQGLMLIIWLTRYLLQTLTCNCELCSSSGSRENHLAFRYLLQTLTCNCELCLM